MDKDLEGFIVKAGKAREAIPIDSVSYKPYDRILMILKLAMTESDQVKR